ncbi:trypsin-7-like [Chrysoperla carnea]|uniref:trypsin-7-like n=1 Tax=Chrysoperla carnea TaxID=189513 RepID=UPI001D07CD73|nr:trypsin-7-like [Chrysoperla carnea]
MGISLRFNCFIIGICICDAVVSWDPMMLYRYRVEDVENVSSHQTRMDNPQKSLRFTEHIETVLMGVKLAKIDDFPYHVAIEHVPTGLHMCSGAILTADVVITAANCLIGTDKEDLLIRVGSAARGKGGRKRKVIEIHIHPEYDENLPADIALLKLRRKLNFSHKIQPVTLPSVEDPLFTDMEMNVTGWSFVNNDYMHATFLRYATVQIMDRDECMLYTQNVLKDITTPSMICAGIGDEKTGCLGDSGSPLVLDRRLYGIASHGTPGCIEQIYPTVYTRITGHRDWIFRISDA